MNYQDILKKCISDGEPVIPEIEAQEICRAYKISCPVTELVTDKEQCLLAAQNIGYPVVIKILSRQIIHKSDVGGVITGIQNSEQLDEAYEQLMDNIKKHCPIAEIKGVIVQKQMSKGVEVVVGGLQNEQFGPVVMFGMGGIYVEVFKDVSFRLAPLDKEEALRQVKETNVYKLLQGVRGEKPCDIDALCDVIVNTGRLISSHPEIKELDFNPVFCYPDGCTVVDARFILKP
ncbi:MAG TPA: acetyl-CoA synthetase [Thermoanaerobacterales bacterium]|nr:acetyl-CoA synthetase [Thermoanaerobacterales bacterium]